MPILSREDAKTILAKVMALSKADQCEANLSGYTGGNIRYARNTVSTSGSEDNTSLEVASAFGKQLGSSTINEFDDASLEKVVRRSEELAKYAPANPEFMDFLEPQKYDQSITMSKQSLNVTPTQRAELAQASMMQCKGKGLVAAGFLENYHGFDAMMNSKGLFAYDQSTSADFSVTVRTDDGTGSGYAIRDYNDISLLDTAKATAIAAEKASKSVDAKAIEPGKYTVILEPAASIGLLRTMFWNIDARSADEGRSYLSKTGGGTRLGEQLLDERVTIYTDPLDPRAPRSTWTGSGLPRKKMTFFEKGVIKNMTYSRYWAQKNGVDPVPYPANILMEGGKATTEEMIKNTKKGILLTRTWYIRNVDPQTLLYTGLTRDGTFYIENGEIKYPIKNLRFNESPIIMLNNLEELGEPIRIDGHMIPTMKVRDFTFTSLSDAI